MSPRLACLVFLGGILGLFYLARERDERTSPWLWLPVIWLAVGGSRPVSSWLGSSSGFANPEQYLEGSPFDRNIFSALILMSVVALISRGRQVMELVGKNLPVLLFFTYCFASIGWSDYPFVTFKHWLKVLGNVMMVMIVLTEENASAALRRLITRTAFVLIPCSVLVIKYYPELGRYYDKWEGKAFYSGVTGDKNMLGVTCLVLGLGLLWRLGNLLREPTDKRRRVVALGTVLAMDLWLLSIADSATSRGCFALGALVIIVLALLRRERTAVVHAMVGGLLAAGVAMYVFRDALAYLVSSLGRDMTLTGRTDLWEELLQMATRPWFGVGFESFFLGERLEALWRVYWWQPLQSHNGYLETYLTLGIVGLCLIGLLFITGYRNVIDLYRRDQSAAGIRLAIIVIAPLYNMTEAAFTVMNPMWILFLLSVTAVAPAMAGAATAPSRVVPAGARPPAPAFVWRTSPAAVMRPEVASRQGGSTHVPAFSDPNRRIADRSASGNLKKFPPGVIS